MAGLEISGTQAGTSTTVTTGEQPKQQAQLIIIEFASLPEDMRTKKVRDFYDKDGSGFLESNNANGQNEIALMQQAFGLDLSKYKSDIVRTDSKKEGNVNEYVGFDSKGNKLVEITEFVGFFIQELRFKNGHNVIEATSGRGNTMCSKFVDYDINYKPSRESEALDNNDVINKNYYKDGYYMFNNAFTKAGYYKTNGDKVYSGSKPEVVETQDLTKGKNNLQQNTRYRVNPQNADLKLTIAEAVKQGKKEKLENYITLNGKYVQSKPIGKGRYEVTDKDGNIFYISHDGVKLDPEYVRQNP